MKIILNQLLNFFTFVPLLHYSSASQATIPNQSVPKRDPWNEAYTLNVMAPLLVGEENGVSWEEFEKLLVLAKEHGFLGVSVDVWWGLVAAKENEMNWSYYDKVFEIILRNGLQIIPILSTHQCGGNVGDTCNIPIPEYIWQRTAARAEKSPSDICYRSEYGNLCWEAIPAHSIDITLFQSLVPSIHLF